VPVPHGHTKLVERGGPRRFCPANDS
jgi:hypothetical protein